MNRVLKVLVPRRLWAKVFLIAALVIFGPYLFSRIRSPWNCVQKYELKLSGISTTKPKLNSIRVMSYNIAHGRGLAKSNLNGGDAQKRRNRLDQIAALLKANTADVVVLNEIDFNAAWSYSRNQAKFLAEKAGYPYVVEQRNLDFRILFWKLSFGNAILSKHPIVEAEVVDFPGFSTVETILAGKKKGIQCTIDLNGKRIKIIGAHLSHRSEDLRVQSAKILNNITKSSPNPVILAGDLNSTPTGFPHSGKAKNGQNAVDILTNSGLYSRFTADAPKGSDLTFRSDKPKSVIDWILIPVDAEFSSYQVKQSLLSDHLPVVSDVLLKKWDSKKP